MEPIVVATWGLVAATALLVVLTFLNGRHHTKAEARQIAVLEAQAKALSESAQATAASAAANQAVADELLEQRKAQNPLELTAVLEDGAGDGVMNASVWRAGTAGIIVARAEILAGKERVPAAEPKFYGNLYLGGGTDKFYLNEPFNRKGHDLIVLRVTGTPENGLEQSREFVYRVTNGRLDRLTSDGVPWAVGTGQQGSSIA
jgi:hypothetical protein